jgi:predicted dinucleotide-binding enzyme
LSALAKETGASAVTTQDAVRDKDLVVVTIPEKNVAALPKDLFSAARPDTIVVDTGNYYPKRDGRIEEIERGTTESRWVSKQLGRAVIKAFNNIYAQHLLDRGMPAGAAGRIALPVAGDDTKAKATVIRLLDELGFDGVDAGALDESWRQQPGTPVYGSDHDSKGVREALAKATPERRAEFRAE